MFGYLIYCKMFIGQVQFSLISYGPEQTKLKALCDSFGVKLIAYSPLGLGMLTGKYSPTSVPTGPRYALCCWETN